jgi:putative tributyrin esterase
MILSEVDFLSDQLQVRCKMNVILPQRSVPGSTVGGHEKFRTLYLLHGFSDDHTAWQRWTSIERYVEGLNLAVVMPSANNSFYTDMAHGGRYYSFFTRELPGICQDLFPLSAERADTFVAGLSMGGYGALKLALSCPEQYAAVASLSGAVDICEVVSGNDPDWISRMQGIFGDLSKVPGSRHDLLALARDVVKLPVRPRIFQCCGTEDFLYPDNLRFRDAIQPLGLEYTYEEGPGIHDWNFWDVWIQRVLKWMFKENE